MTTRAEAIQAAGRVAGVMKATLAASDPREQAEAAWTPTCGVTVEQLEDEIRANRGLPLAHAS